MTRWFLIIAVVSLAVIAVSVYVIVLTVRVSPPGSGVSRHDRESDQSPVIPGSTVTVRVAVLNGCGRPGIAAAFVRRLREHGFDVVNGNGGNADSFEFSRSVVVDRRGNRTYAERVARCLGIRTVLNQRTDNPYLIEDVAVVLGRDWETLLIPKKEKAE